MATRQHTMKTLFLTDYYLPHAGGSRVYYHNLLKNWVAQFPDRVTVLTKKVPGWEQFDRQESAGSLRILRQFKPLPDWKVRQLPKIVFPLSCVMTSLLREEVDLIHVGDLYPQGVIGLGMKRLWGVPYVAYCHGEEITQTERYRFQPRVRNRIYLEADGVVAACEFARQHLLRIGIPEERIHKISPGVDWERFSPHPPSPELVRQLSLQGKKVLLTVSRLCPRKGHDIVMKAMAKLIHVMPELHYLIVGRGPEEGRLRGIAAELGLRNAVSFVGYVPEEQLPQFYDLCDLFVMPNREEDGDVEGFGMVFLEASAAGKPVVGGRSGGTNDSVLDGVTGFLVDPEDIAELAARLKQVIVDPSLRQKLGDAGLRRARSEFDWGTRARRLREISSAVVDRWRTGRVHNPVPMLPVLSSGKDLPA